MRLDLGGARMNKGNKENPSRDSLCNILYEILIFKPFDLRENYYIIVGGLENV